MNKKLVTYNCRRVSLCLIDLGEICNVPRVHTQWNCVLSIVKGACELVKYMWSTHTHRNAWTGRGGGLLWKLCQRCDAPAGQDWGATAWRVILPRSTSKLVNSANTIRYSAGSLLKRLSEPGIKLSLPPAQTLHANLNFSLGPKMREKYFCRQNEREKKHLNVIIDTEKFPLRFVDALDASEFWVRWYSLR